jgi:hypothetical protein
MEVCFLTTFPPAFILEPNMGTRFVLWTHIGVCTLVVTSPLPFQSIAPALCVSCQRRCSSRPRPGVPPPWTKNDFVTRPPATLLRDAQVCGEEEFCGEEDELEDRDNTDEDEGDEDEDDGNDDVERKGVDGSLSTSTSQASSGDDLAPPAGSNTAAATAAGAAAAAAAAAATELAPMVRPDRLIPGLFQVEVPGLRLTGGCHRSCCNPGAEREWLAKHKPLAHLLPPLMPSMEPTVVFGVCEAASEVGGGIRCPGRSILRSRFSSQVPGLRAQA